MLTRPGPRYGRTLPYAYVGLGDARRPTDWTFGHANEVADDFTFAMRKYVWRNL